MEVDVSERSTTIPNQRSGQPGVAAEDDHPSVEVGRRAPYTQVGDWVLLAPIPAQAKVLYWALAAHVNVGEHHTRVWPIQDTLAGILGLSRGGKVKPYLDALVSIDAVTVKTSRYAGGMRQRCVYTVHLSPPGSHAEAALLADFYAQRD